MDVGIWEPRLAQQNRLTCPPLKAHGFTLTKAAEFRDAVHLRYGWHPEGLPPPCSCTADSSSQSAMPSPQVGTGGFCSKSSEIGKTIQTLCRQAQWVGLRTRGTRFKSCLGSSRRHWRIMLAKSWNYAFMDSRIMLAKSSYYALARRDTYTHFVVLMEPQSSENCAFSYLQVAISTTKYMNIPIPR